MLPVAAYILVLLSLGPAISWVHPEIQIIDFFITHTNAPWYQLIFNYEHLEFAPRFTRPLSSLFQVLDSYIRLSLPKGMYSYSQSWSLTWAFSLILNPLLMYRLVFLWTGDRLIALFAFCLYLLSPTNLSSAVMFFRPGKVLAQFFLLLVLDMASRYVIKRETSLKRLMVIGCVVFLGIMSDEGGWFSLPAVFLLFLIFYRDKAASVLGILVVASLLAAAHYFWILPSVSAAIWGGNQQLGDYFILKDITHSATPVDTLILLLHRFSKAFAAHIFIFPKDTFALFITNPGLGGWWQLLFIVNAGISAFMLICAVYVLKKDLLSKSYVFIYFFLCFIGGVIFHSLLMVIVGNQVFGPYYYGGFISIYLLLCYAWLWKMVFTLAEGPGLNGRLNALSLLSVVVMMIAQFHTFQATNILVKDVHYYHPASVIYREYFANQLDRFSVSEPFTEQQKDLIERFYSMRGNCIDLPVELLWHATNVRALQGYGFPPGDKTMTVCK